MRSSRVDYSSHYSLWKYAGGAGAWLSLLLFGLFPVLHAQTPPAGPLTVQLEAVASGLQSPIEGANAGDGSGRLFIVEQPGRVRILQNGALLSTSFLDVQNKLVRINSSYDERGLLGLVFHPHFAENGRFFIYYSAPGGPLDHHSVLAEYHVSPTDPNQAAAEERILFTVDEPETNHNGGHLAFGPDGMLYIALGDGGGANDMHGPTGNGQNLNTRLGKILRIDVDREMPYAIPHDNPFVGRDGVDEIWAYGLRNPWKYSFDRGGDHRLFAADVGQNRIEEMNIITRGGNYGWRIMEGSECFNPRTNCDSTGITLPIAEFTHDVGISITGGYVYRGRQYASLFGKYLCADWSGILFSLTETTDGAWELERVATAGRGLSPVGFFITSFMEDENGELYLLSNPTSSPVNRNGMVWKITVPGDAPVRVEDWKV